MHKSDATEFKELISALKNKIDSIQGCTPEIYVFSYFNIPHIPTGQEPVSTIKYQQFSFHGQKIVQPLLLILHYCPQLLRPFSKKEKYKRGILARYLATKEISLNFQKKKLKQKNVKTHDKRNTKKDIITFIIK